MKATLLTITFFLFSPLAFGGERVRVGYGEADITPAVGGSMPGYFRERLSTGVLDPLRAKALTLSKDQTTLVIVALDLIGLEATEVGRIRRAIQERTGIAAHHVFVHSTHTHTGAETPRRFTSDADALFPGLFPGKVDEEWLAGLPGKVASAVEKALSARVPESRAVLGMEREDTIAFYRRYLMRDGSIRTNPGRGNPDIVRPAGEIDPMMHVLSFETARTLLVSYGLHPDCIGGTQYSADYPYHLTQFVRETLGDGWNVLYLNAACGNINHVDVRNPDQRSSYEESRRIGRTLARAALKAREHGRELNIQLLASRTKTAPCALRKAPPEVAQRAELEIRNGVDFERRNFNELFSPGAYVLNKTRDRFHPAEIIVFRIGSLGLVGLPAEVFVEIAREIRQKSPIQPALVIGVTGGYMGYMPHERGYEEGGYEAGYRSARYQPSTPALWIRTALDLLREIR